jgi:pilus assembly protein Flp/PilA
MLQFISTLLNKFRREDEDGQTLVEYGLLLALIAIIVIVALLFLGPIVSHISQTVGQNRLGTCPPPGIATKPPSPRATPGGLATFRGRPPVDRL